MDKETDKRKSPKKRRKQSAEDRRKRLFFQKLAVFGTALILLFSLITALRLSEAEKAKEAEKERKEAEIAREESMLTNRRTAIAKADELALGYDYDAAINLLMEEENYDSDPELTSAIAGFIAERSHLEAKDVTQVPHIFFHSLIVDSSLAFNAEKLGASTAGGNNAWMTTVDEFDKIIRQMYENGWVLVRMRDLVTVNEDGTFLKNKNLLLPVNKKPYVLSIDDWSYYHAYAGQGYADKAVVDADGKVKCSYTDAEGKVLIGDYDVVPRLNSFLEEHPDAAYKGARGMIAMTGYNGVFGYRTDAAYKTRENLDRTQAEWLNAHPDFDYEAEVAEAKKVAEAVKASGWEFACHTWGHLSVTNASVEALRIDQEKWQNTVAPILGKTDTIIFAHGNDIGSFRDYSEDNEKYAYLKSMGYDFYANVDASTKYWVQIRQNYVRQGRIDCDGYQMWRALSGAAKTNVFEDLFDVSSVFSSARPTPVTAVGKA
ncbi:MAG: polysaccharide deacetylase [Lachnospiraceae bacterium]|nr:polysaccharide deacetylase [Lachnospiraceae bacterium]